MSKLFAHIRQLGGDRTPYIASAVQRPVEKVLDIGCSYGWALDALTGKAETLVGIDMDEAALRQAGAQYPHIQFVHQDASTLPFEDETFDVVILSEVIEHVGDENKQLVIDEAHRVLKPGGLFIFTAPYAGLFAWADPMDFKRRFPGIYRLYMRLTDYEPDTPIEVGHKHLSWQEVQQLFADRFRIEEVRYCGLLMPFLTWVLAADARLRLLPRRLHGRLNDFRAWESGVPYGRVLSYNMRLLARKRPAAPRTVRVRDKRTVPSAS